MALLKFACIKQMQTIIYWNCIYREIVRVGESASSTGWRSMGGENGCRDGATSDVRATRFAWVGDWLVGQHFHQLVPLNANGVWCDEYFLTMFNCWRQNGVVSVTADWSHLNIKMRRRFRWPTFEYLPNHAPLGRLIIERHFHKRPPCDLFGR